MGVKYTDDKFDFLRDDRDKIRQKHRMFISYSNQEAATAVCNEIIYNALDECKSSKSPGNKIHIEFDERTGFITVQDNGRGIPTNIMEELFTTLNSGSNIFSSNKDGSKDAVLGQNGIGTLAIAALAENAYITSFRGGTEGIYKTLIFEEGIKVTEETGQCNDQQHGMKIIYKPSKVMGKQTRIVWKDIEKELQDLQFLNKKKIAIDSVYYDKKGKPIKTVYKIQPFQDILLRNDKEHIISARHEITIESDNITEEMANSNLKRYLSMDIAFCYSTAVNPYIDSFSNSNQTVDSGDHLDGAIEALCRYLQTVTKQTLSDRDKLDIKWDDVKTGLSIVVSLRTNYEHLYTGQTKHKVVSPEIKKAIISMTMEKLPAYFSDKQGQLKELINIVKTNARARREGDKIKSAVVKSGLSTWSSYKIKNFDPCTAKGIKEYKEIFLIEGDSAKGSLKQARDPRYQALFSFRGVSKNVFRATLDQVIGQNGNQEFTNLVTVLGCNVGPKFDMNKLNYNKIIIASDADEIPPCRR